MGYFSKCCAKTHLPVVVESLGIPHLNNVVALLPDGRKFEGSYDGYGRVGSSENGSKIGSRCQRPDTNSEGAVKKT